MKIGKPLREGDTWIYAYSDASGAEMRHLLEYISPLTLSKPHRLADDTSHSGVVVVNARGKQRVMAFRRALASLARVN